jgi:galactose-1-phosphate uridylyltransferase
LEIEGRVKSSRLETPPMVQIEIPLKLTVDLHDLQNKKLPVQELASALKGVDAIILGKVLEGIDATIVSSMQKGYGENEYHKHQKEERTIVTQLGKTTFSVTRLRDKSTGRTFCPLYSIVEFDERRIYQRDVAAMAVDFALSMSYRDSRQRLERITESPSHSTIWRMQELGMEAESFEFGYDSFVSADGTKLHAQRSRKLEVRVIAGESVAVGINESYEKMKEEHDIRAIAVGDADKDLNCFEERQIDLIHVWREVNYKLWEHEVDLETRKRYVREVKGILLRLKNSLDKLSKEKIEEVEKALNEFVKEMESKGYWRVVRFFKKHMKSILLFAYKRLEGISIPWHNNWMERLMGEIAKRMKNKWMSWSARGAKNLLNLLLRRYAEKEKYESFIAKLIGKNYKVEVKFQV